MLQNKHNINRPMSRTKNVLSKFCLLKSFLFLCKKENIMNIQQIKDDRDRLQHSLNLLIAQIGPIQIGSVKQFPFGWRKAAKGRTVWRIIEEAITQNIEKHYRELSIDNVHISDSEVSVYDMSCTYAATIRSSAIPYLPTRIFFTASALCRAIRSLTSTLPSGEA